MTANMLCTCGPAHILFSAAAAAVFPARCMRQLDRNLPQGPSQAVQTLPRHGHLPPLLYRPRRAQPPH